MLKKVKGFLRKLNLKSQKTNLIATENPVGNVNKLSEKQVSNFCKLPTNNELAYSNFLSGDLKIGTVDINGETKNLYFDDTYSLGLLISGGMASGKGEYMLNYVKDVIDHRLEKGESLVFIDYIKDSKISKYIKNNIPEDRLVNISLDDLESFPALNFNEINCDEIDDNLIKINELYHKAHFTVNLITTINPSETLSASMRRYLMSSCIVVYSVDNNAPFNDIIGCLQNYETRMKFINNIPKNLEAFLGDEIGCLLKLNNEPKKDTFSSKVAGLIDVLYTLKTSNIGREMCRKACNPSGNFTKYFEEGKVILIELNSSNHSSKDILTSFFIRKIIIGCQERLSKQNYENTKKVHLLIDEIGNIPYSMNILEEYFSSRRQLRLNLILSTINPDRLPNRIKEGMLAGGFNYMLLASCGLNAGIKRYFNYLKEHTCLCRSGFDYEDFIKLDKYNSFNLITSKEGRPTSFMTKLPNPIRE